jgi:hypothetical protein
MATNIDWTKVKKSPIPKDAEEGLVGWYRGSGIKIGVYNTGIRITDSDDNLLASRPGTYLLNTGEVKELAAEMLAGPFEPVVKKLREEQKTERPRSGMKGRVRLSGTGVRHYSRSGRRALAGVR